MSSETLTWLNQNVLVGFTDKRGKAWHYKESEQGEESNSYPGAIPIDDVRRRLFHWQAVEAPIEASLHILSDDGVTEVKITDPTRKAIIRPDTQTILGVFKDGYVPHQFDQWLLTQVAEILDDGELQIGSAGLLKGGALAWVSVEVSDTITTPEGVAFRPHLLATTSLDGSLATTYKPVVTNVVCDNTHAGALGEDGEVFRVKHSRRSIGKLQDVRDKLGIVHAIADDFKAEVKTLCEVGVSGQTWSRFLEEWSPTKGKDGRALTIADNRKQALNALWTNDERVSPWRDTAWGVVAAVNTFEHHIKTAKGGNRVERNMLRACTNIEQLDTSTLDHLTAALAAV